MGLEYFLGHKNIQSKSPDSDMIRLKLPIHPDNVETLKPHLDQDPEGNYVTSWFNKNTINNIFALEGPIFRSAPQQFHNLLTIEGLKRGYLFADPITFAEEFGSNETPNEVRKKIYENWTNSIKNSDATIAMTEYGEGFDPGVVTGSIIQLNEGKPVLGLSLDKNNKNNVFSNSIENLYLKPEEVDSFINRDEGHRLVLDKIMRNTKYLTSPNFKKPNKFSNQKTTKKEYDVLITYENNIEGIINANNIEKKLKNIGRDPTLLGKVSKNFNHIYDLNDLADYISKSNHVVVLGDDSSEPGVIGSSTIQLSKILETPVDMLRGDFRILTGEGEGAGFNQPSKGLYGASNLMIESLLPRGMYTKIYSLTEDLRY